MQHVGDHREEELAEDEEEREAPPDERGVAARLARLAAQAALLILRPPRTRVRPEALRVPAVAHQPVAPVVVDGAAPRVEAVVHRDRLVPTHAAGARPGAHEARRRRRHDEDPRDKRERDDGARQEERTAHGLQKPGRRHLRQQRLAHEEEDERHALREEGGMGVRARSSRGEGARESAYHQAEHHRHVRDRAGGEDARDAEEDAGDDEDERAQHERRALPVRRVEDVHEQADQHERRRAAARVERPARDGARAEAHEDVVHDVAVAHHREDGAEEERRREHREEDEQEAARPDLWREAR